MITIDFETSSEADLKKVGAWAYSEHPTTGIICLCYGIDGYPIQEWWPGHDNTIPCDLLEAIDAGHLIEAHNVAFERSIWTNVCTKRWGWPEPKHEQWRDLMAVACYYALPAKLDKLAKALGYSGKSPEGGRLISRYSKLHLKTARREIPADDFRKFVEYCRNDVQLEQAISDYLGDLPERELPVFLLDQKVNLRGLYLDVAGIAAASEIVDQRAADLTAEFHGITGVNPTQRDKVMAWFAEQGVILDNMQGEYLEELLEDGSLGQGAVRRAIQIRLAINKASTKKLDAMARQRGVDGRARWQSRYHGAATGRNTGSGFQPLNLSRGWDWSTPDSLVRDINRKDARWLDCVYGNAMEAVAKASRHWITAAPGNKLLSGDFVSVEAVILACLAGETWKVDAFRSGAKIYEAMADKIYRLPPGTVTKKTHPLERQDGKTAELAFGYQGALNAWLNFDDSGRHTDERIIEICKAWRLEHPAICQFWRDLDNAALEAVTYGRLASAGPIGFEIEDRWLTMILPDGKRLWYFAPQIKATRPQWHQPETKEECRAGTCDCGYRPQVTYMAQKFGQWKRVYTYGGKLAENATQAVSRQRLVPSMLRAEAAGYHVILSVYDEIVAEVPKNFGSVKEFEDIMREPAGAWDADWPINVDAWEGERYKK